MTLRHLNFMFVSTIISPSELVRYALREHESALVGHAYGILHDLDLARDAVQDALLRLYQQPEGKVTQVTVKSWLYTVVGNRCIDMLRKNRRLVSLDSLERHQSEQLLSTENENEETDSSEDAKENLQKVVQLFTRLPANQQEVLRLKFQGELSYKEISEATGLSVSNVGFLIHTALKRLRSLVTPNDNPLRA